MEARSVPGVPKTFVPGVAPRIEFMEKNSKKYASTGGWGFGRFVEGKPVDEKVHAACFRATRPTSRTTTSSSRDTPRNGGVEGAIAVGFHVTPLRSGSSGNLTLVEHAGTVLLVDAGLPSQRGLVAALSEATALGTTWTRCWSPISTATM